MAIDPKLPWVPVITVDLRGLRPKQFEEKQKEFYAATKDRTMSLHKTLNTGWHTITPQIAEEALLGKANRKIALADVQHYGRQMVEGKWMPTGETICIDRLGVMRQGYHRCWAAYLSGASFRTFVVVDVEPIPDLFAFYDAGRKRSNIDALQTAGLNGFSGIIDATVKIAVCYDTGFFDKGSGVKAPRMTQFEVLEYVRAHPEMREIISDTVSEHQSLIDELFARKRDVICFAACRIVTAHGNDVFEDFMAALDDDTIKHGAAALLRQKLEKDVAHAKPKEALKKKAALAFVIKAFNAWHAGKAMKKLSWSVDEAMPEFDVPDDADADAEEDEMENEAALPTPDPSHPSA